MNEAKLEHDESSAFKRPWFHVWLGKEWICCLFLAVVGFLVRFPALQGEYVWDDDYLIRTNAFIKSPLLILEAFRHYLFLDSYSTHYRPVQNLSYMVDYFFWNGNLYGFHLSNILFHVASAVLLYFLLRKLFAALIGKFDGKIDRRDEKYWIGELAALCVATLWVVHPVHSAAVDYISGRADSLAFFFACGGWLLFLKARELHNRISRTILFSLAWLSGLTGLCSRESACIWVIIFLLYLLAFERRTEKWRKWAVVAACLLMLAGYVGLRYLPRERGVVEAPSDSPPSLRAVLMLRALGDYSRLMILPSNLHMERTVFNPAAFHSEKVRRNRISLEYLSIGGLIALGAFTCLAIRPGAAQRVRIFGVAWFLLGFLPVSNLIELNATVAEHWLYLPSVGFLIFLAGCALDFSARWRRVSVAFACLALLGLGARSFVRSSDWTSNETFAQRTIASGGGSVRIAMLLAQVYSARGEHEKAEGLLRRALQIYPDYPIARNNLADAVFHQGKEKEAETLFASATEAAQESKNEYPRTWIAALNFARVLHKKHDDAGAIAVLEKARPDYPYAWELISSESELLRGTNDLDAAIALVRPFAKNHWWHYGAWLALGRVCAEKGDIEAADSALRRASALDVHETAALNLIALMRMRENRLDDAVRTQRRAVAREPGQPRQHLLLSSILDKMGRDDESRAALAEATRLRTFAKDLKAAN